MPKRVPDSLKSELRDKVYIYEKNLMNGCRVELSMYHDQLQEYGMKIEDHLQIGPFSGKELLDVLDLDPEHLNHEKKLSYLAMLSDAFVEKGFETNAYLPRPKKGEVEVKTVHFSGASKELREELSLSKWDRFWAFFGIQTKHAEQVRESQKYQEYQEDKKHQLMQAAQKAMRGPQKVEELQQLNQERVKYNEDIVNARTSEKNKLLEQFLGKNFITNYERQTKTKVADDFLSVEGAKLTPLNYCIARVFQKTGKDMSREDCGLSPQELEEIGAEYWNTAHDNQKSEQQKARELLGKIQGDGSKVFQPEESLNEKSTASEIGKASVYLEAKKSLGVIFKGENKAYLGGKKQRDHYIGKVERAAKELIICDYLKKGNVVVAQNLAVEAIQKSVKNDVLRKAAEKMPNLSLNNKSKLSSDVYNSLGVSLDPESHSWKKALTLTNILMQEREKEMFPMKLDLKEKNGKVILGAKAVTTKTHNRKMPDMINSFSVPDIIKEEPEAEMEDIL